MAVTVPRPLLRALSLIQVVAILLQATLAGHILTGNPAARAVHEQVATTGIAWVALLQVLVAGLLWRPARGPAWPLPTTAVLFVGVILQLGWGYGGRLALHVPVGVGLLVGQLGLAVSLGRSRSGTSLPWEPAR